MFYLRIKLFLLAALGFHETAHPGRATSSWDGFAGRVREISRTAAPTDVRVSREPAIVLDSSMLSTSVCADQVRSLRVSFTVILGNSRRARALLILEHTDRSARFRRLFSVTSVSPAEQADRILKSIRPSVRSSNGGSRGGSGLSGRSKMRDKELIAAFGNGPGLTGRNKFYYQIFLRLYAPRW